MWKKPAEKKEPKTAHVTVELSLREAAFLQYLVQDFRNEPDNHPAWDYKLSTNEALAIYNKLFR